MTNVVDFPKSKLTGQHSANNNDLWFTPEKYVEAARTALSHIDLDPASCFQANETVKAKHFFDKEINGLEQRWFGNVWLNPPFSRKLLPLFAKKMVNSFNDGDIKHGIFLMNANTDTATGQLLLDNSIAQCFPRGRISFINAATGEPENGNNKGQMICCFGDNADALKFFKAFKDIGYVSLNPQIYEIPTNVSEALNSKAA